jgi:hypothetical protein
VHHERAAASYTVAREIGHLIGVRHEISMGQGHERQSIETIASLAVISVTAGIAHRCAALRSRRHLWWRCSFRGHNFLRR